LSVFEQIDLNWRLNLVFEFSDRRPAGVFEHQCSAVTVGVLASIFIIIVSPIARFVEKGLGRLNLPRWLGSAGAILFSAGIAAIILNQIPRLNLFIIGWIRELEKIRMLRETLLNHERSASYLMLMAIVTICALAVVIVRASTRMPRYIKLLWIAALAAAILFSYYTDSRVEVQLYEFTMHRALYLAVASNMALVGTVVRSRSAISRWEREGKTRRRVLSAGAAAVLLASAIFTFLRFDANQSLKTQIFFRSTQAKQNFLLAWWVLDRDRDGYCALLDGGDSAENNAGINPGVPERVGDGIDNNGLAGDLTQEDLDAWRNPAYVVAPCAAIGAATAKCHLFFVDTVGRSPKHLRLSTKDDAESGSFSRAKRRLRERFLPRGAYRRSNPALHAIVLLGCQN
jgi:hypothetical protein